MTLSEDVGLEPPHQVCTEPAADSGQVGTDLAVPSSAGRGKDFNFIFVGNFQLQSLVWTQNGKKLNIV